MDAPLKVLLADDDVVFIAPYLISHTSQADNIQIDSVASATGCIQSIRDSRYHAVLLDINFGQGAKSGVDVISEIRQLQPDIKIIMLSGQDDEVTVLTCLDLGADDFLSKSIEQLPQVADYLRGMQRNQQNLERETTEAQKLALEVGSVYVSAQMQEVFNKVMLARRNPQLPVLITGATGVGKDLVARAISHGLGKPRVDVDCGAIPESLIESEFFGHLKGSFTGATSNKIGKFQTADGGDLFLDEIGNLRRSSQDRFLRAIQHGEVTAVGSTTPTKVKVRVIAATNENFDEMIKSGRFRQDLFERLKGVWIEIPDLRARTEDIEPIVAALLKTDKRDLSISSTCLAILRNYEWPGNIRELESAIREMMANCNTRQLSILHLPERLKERLLRNARRSPEAGLDQPVFSNVLLPSQRSYPLPVDGELDDVIDRLLVQYLPERFQKLGTQRSQAELAKSLGIARNTLSGYLKRLKIELPIEGST